MQIAKWNYTRNNTNFNPEVEHRMLREEALEFKYGMDMYFVRDTISNLEHNEQARVTAIIEMVDAWADFYFVLSGSIYKSLGTHEAFDFDHYRTQERYMYNLLTTDLEIPCDVLDNCLQVVIDANNAKGAKKLDGKVQKGDNWKDPKDVIAAILEVL